MAIDKRNPNSIIRIYSFFVDTQYRFFFFSLYSRKPMSHNRAHIEIQRASTEWMQKGGCARKMFVVFLALWLCVVFNKINYRTQCAQRLWQFFKMEKFLLFSRFRFIIFVNALGFVPSGSRLIYVSKWYTTAPILWAFFSSSFLDSACARKCV